MEKTNLLTLVVTLTVGIILAGSLLMPVLSDATATDRTFTNNGYYRMSETDQETTIEWTPSVDPFTITVNGEDISIANLNQYGDSSYSLAFADDIVIRFYYQNATTQNIQVWKGDYQTGCSSTYEYTLTITINDSGVSWATNDSDFVTRTFVHAGEYFVIDPKGEYVMKFRESSAYVLEDSTIFYAGGISGIASGTFSSIYLEGTVNDYTVTPMRNYVTISNESSTYDVVTTFIGLVALEKLTFDSTYSPPGGTETERTQTYNYFLVPYQVTAELAHHLDAGEIALMNALPVLVIIGLVLAGVGAIFIRNRD